MRAKHEYHDGVVTRVAYDSVRHYTICVNIAAELHSRLRRTSRQVLGSNMRVAAVTGRHYQYPDALVIEGSPEFDPLAPPTSTLQNPSLVVEVWSDLTEAYDRGKKFDRYREVASLKEYVLVSSNEPRVEVFFRQTDGTWLFAAFTGLDAVARLQSIAVELPFSEVYDRVEFPPQPPEPESPEKPAT